LLNSKADSLQVDFLASIAVTVIAILLMRWFFSGVHETEGMGVYKTPQAELFEYEDQEK